MSENFQQNPNFKFKIFEIKDGKFTVAPSLNPKKIWTFIVSSILILIIVSLSGWLKISEKDVWKLYYLMLQQFGLNNDSLKIKREKEVEARVEIEIDQAILDYQRLTGDDGIVRIPPPKYIEKPIDESVCYSEECKSLGGEMRLCAPWVESCKSDDIIEN